MGKLDSVITAVTVYTDRARVVRRGKCEVEAGVQRVEIPELTTSLNPDSARVTARGTAKARLLGLQMQRVFYSETPAEAARELEEQIEALQDEIGAVKTRQALVKAMRARLDELAGHSELYATALAAGEMAVDKQLDLFEALRQRAGELDAEALELAVKGRGQERQLAKLKSELDKLRGARPRQRYAAFVELEAQSGGELEIELSYVAANAGWKPLYDLRLLEDGEAPELEVGYLAQVTQKTGEDWEEVGMTLSTARPAQAAALPELEAWYIGPRPAPTAQRARPARPMAAAAGKMKAMAADFSAGDVPEAEPMELAAAEVIMAEVDSSGAAVSYHAPGTVSVPADGAAHKVNVASYALKPELDYVTAPKLVEAVYRRAKAHNDSPYTLLPGSANLFAGEEFIGATHLELTAPQGEIELYFGVDDRVTVARELKRRDVDKRLIGGKRRIRYAFEISLENLLATPIQVSLQDHIPMARHEDIKVKLERAEPAPGEHSELNLLEWEIALEAKQEQTVRYDFSVEYPQEMEVVGLP